MNQIDNVLAQRGARYGDFTDHANICQNIKLAMIKGPAKWNYLSDVQKQALEVMADKIARILSGDPNYDDNWIDIQGYAKLVQDRLPKKAEDIAAKLVDPEVSYLPQSTRPYFPPNELQYRALRQTDVDMHHAGR